MGLIARRLSEYAEVRNDTGWLTRDDGEDGGTRTSAGVVVNAKAALGLSTVWRCVDLLSSSVSQAPKDIILKIGGRSFPEFTKPAWLVTPNPADPTFTANDHFAEVALSLLLDGNFFVSVAPHVFDPQVLTVLNPARVRVKPGPVFEILDDHGQVERRLGPAQMLHGTWMRLAGMLRGISPLEALRRGIGAAIAAEDFGARFFGQGAALSFGVETPGPLTSDQKAELAASLRKKHAGLSNSHAIGILTAGAKFVSGLAPTPEQAQMLATRKFSVEDLCRPYGVPPGMAGSQEPGAASYASAAVWDLQFKQRAVQPLAERIEAQYNRIVTVPDNVGDPNASAQFKVNLDHVARADLQTRATAGGEYVAKGIKTPNEVRALEDLAPLAGGDVLYMQQQMVPLSDLGKTKATEPLNTQPAPAGAPTNG